MKRHLGKIILLILLFDGSAVPRQLGNSAAVSKPEKRPSLSAASDIRIANNLRALHDLVLAQTLNAIKKSDDAGTRLSARNQMLRYLAGKETPAEESLKLAANVAAEALADYEDHSDEVPPFMADFLLSDLGAWIAKYDPSLNEEFQKATKERELRPTDRIRALFGMKDGDHLAARAIVQLLEEGQNVDGLVFWLTELRQRNSSELTPLLVKILVMGDRGPTVSMETLYWVTSIYLSDEVPKSIRRGFLAMVVARTQQVTVMPDSISPTAYDLLMAVMPHIRQLTPNLYNQALTQSFALQSSLSAQRLANEARSKRLRESPNPIEDLLGEVESAKSTAARNELLAGAAQIALDAKKMTQCLDIVSNIQFEKTLQLSDFWRDWTDQFLQNYVTAALSNGNSDLAQKAADRIATPLRKVESLVTIAGYREKANDKIDAQRVWVDARKTAEEIPDYLESAEAFLLLSINCDRTDPTQKASLLESGIKAMNSLPKPDLASQNKPDHELYARRVNNLAVQLRKTFRGVTWTDQNGAIALIEKIQKAELRPFAMIGLLQGLDDLLLTAKKT